MSIRLCSYNYTNVSMSAQRALYLTAFCGKIFQKRKWALHLANNHIFVCSMFLSSSVFSINCIIAIGVLTQHMRVGGWKCFLVIPSFQTWKLTLNIGNSQFIGVYFKPCLEPSKECISVLNIGMSVIHPLPQHILMILCFCSGKMSRIIHRSC